MANKKQEKKQAKQAKERSSARSRRDVNTRATQIRKVNRTLRAGGLKGLEQFLGAAGQSPGLMPGVNKYAAAAMCAFKNRGVGSRFKV